MVLLPGPGRVRDSAWCGWWLHWLPACRVLTTQGAIAVPVLLMPSMQPPSLQLSPDKPLAPPPLQVRRLMPNIAGKTPFSVLLARGSGGACARTSQLADLLEKMMALDPDKRIDPDTALRHPFLKDYLPKKR